MNTHEKLRSTDRRTRVLSIHIALLASLAIALLTACPGSSGSDEVEAEGDSGGYRITYNANGATSGTAPTDSKEYAGGDTATVLGKGSLALPFNGFTGWNTAADGSGTSYAAGATVTVSANLTLYARWKANEWKALGSGTDGPVFALTRDSANNIYAGGAFSIAGDLRANNVAMWNGSSWSALGDGLVGNLVALAFDKGKLYAGGRGLIADGSSLGSVAVFDGSDWSSRDCYTDGDVRAIACDSSDNLYVGGLFINTDSQQVNYIAKWDESASTWSALDKGLNAQVTALVCDSLGNLYAGGEFTATSDASTTLGGVAKWDGSTWSDLGGGMNGYINALAYCNGKLYAGGFFTTAGGVPAKNVAMWDGTKWSPLGDGVDLVPATLACDSAGNLFTHMKAKDDGHGKTKSAPIAECIVEWNGSGWSTLSGAIDSSVRSIICDSSDNLYAGGAFSEFGKLETNNIAVLNR